MKAKRIKQSEKALLSVIGVLAAMVVISVALSGVSGSSKDAENLQNILSGSNELTGFNRIDIQGDWQVNLAQGDEWQVQWSDDEQSKSTDDKVQVYVNDETLKLKRKKKGKWWDDHRQTTTVDIVMPELKELEIAGGVQINMSGFEGDELDIDIAGAVQLNAENGYYNELNLGAAGASDINLRGVVVEDVDIDIAGASDVTLTMDGGKLSGSLAGAGQILYYGEVSEEDISITGFGTVNRAE